MLTQTAIQLFRSPTDANIKAIPFSNVLKLVFYFAVVPIEMPHLSNIDTNFTNVDSAQSLSGKGTIRQRDIPVAWRPDRKGRAPASLREILGLSQLIRDAQ